MHSHSIRLFLPLAIAAFLLGCTADQQQLQQAATQAANTLSQAQADQTALQNKLTTLPSDDPSRATLQAQLAQLNQIIAQVQAVLPSLNSAAQSSTAGAIDPVVQQAAAAIPYGSLALAVASMIFALIKHIQAGNLSDQEQQLQKAFQQLVTGLDAALPNPTADQQAKVDAALDSDVKAKVAAVRAN